MKAVLFDLDGTLADTAPDLAAAANALRRDAGLTALPLERLRPFASQGARGLVREAIGLLPEHDGYEAARQAFLSEYETNICVATCLFPGVAAMLSQLHKHGIPWGIVTNKMTRYTTRLLAQGLMPVAPGVVVCGDTTAHAKPHPAPMLYAAQQLGVATADCVYFGDDLRDIEAGRAAGMTTVAAAYGYCALADCQTWGADSVVARSEDLWAWIQAHFG